MKKINLLKVTLGIISMFLMVFTVSSFIPSLHADLAAMLPAWLGTTGTAITAAASFMISPDGRIMAKPQTGLVSASAQAAANPRINNGMALNTRGGVDPTIRVIQDAAIQLNFNITYTIGGTYVANTDIPIIPYLTSDTLPTGCTLASNQFASQAAYAGWYGSGQKKALFGYLNFAGSDSRYISNGKLRVRTYNDVSSVQNDSVVNLTAYAPIEWQNQYLTNIVNISDANYLTGDLNSQITLQLPAVTGTMDFTVYVKDSNRGATLTAAKQ